MGTPLRRSLGRCGLEASQLGLGCMRLPLLAPTAEADTLARSAADLDVPAAVELVRRAIDGGVDYLDTAYPYHGSSFHEPGRSEPLLARALAGGYRERVLLATKLPVWLVETRADMDRLLDEQLKRLEVRCLDVYLAHNLNAKVWPRIRDLGLFDFLDAACKDGRIRHAGFSFHDQYALFAEILESRDWSLAQIQYNYLDADYQAGLRGLQLAARKGVGVVVMEPLRGGFLVNHIPSGPRAGLEAARPEWSMADWALRWLWDQPEVGVVLSGMSAMPQLEENLRIAADARAGTWGRTEHLALEGVRRHFAERMKIGCTACGYCLPCPAGVAIPKVFTLYNEAFFGDDPGAGPRAAAFHTMIMAPEEKADRCTACGACREKCPQQLPIPETLAAAAKLFAPAPETV